MSPYRRNVLVGITMLVALSILAWMILQFGATIARPFAPATIPVKFITDRADGLADGSPVIYCGVDTGHVTRVRLSKERTSVVVDAVLNAEPALPSNVTGRIRASSILGSGSTIVLEVNGPLSETPIQRGQVIQASYGGSEFLPPEFTELARDLAQTSRQFRESNIIKNLNEQIARAG
ncbi:MAG: MlaD family protein, partial [Tepidisphaeraceae bacterium]